MGLTIIMTRKRYRIFIPIMVLLLLLLNPVITSAYTFEPSYYSGGKYNYSSASGGGIAISDCNYNTYYGKIRAYVMASVPYLRGTALA